MIKILNIIPIIYSDDLKAAFKDREKLANDIWEETNGLVKLETVALEKGTASIESSYDEYVNAPYILQKVKWAEENNYNAVTIDCFGDPALDAAREIVRIPVIGANHSSIFLAAQLAHRFTVINILRETEPLIRSLIAKYGLTQHLASVETIEVPVLDLEKDPLKLVDKIVEAGKKAYNTSSAYALVLGCTGMSFIAEKAQERLFAEEIEIPVIEPLRAAIYTAMSWVLLKKSHSKAAYMPPRPKTRIADFTLPIK